MENVLSKLRDEELSELLNDFRKKSKEKREEGGFDEDSDEDQEGYRMLAGNLRSGSINGYHYDSARGGTYINGMLPAWRAFTPTHGGSKPPDPIVRALMPSREPLAFALQQLVRYSIEKFDYVELRMLCGMDAFFTKGGVGFARHRWDDHLGIARTERFDPKNVFVDYSASSFAKASHIIERHKVPRYEFAKKFGKKAAKDADACKDSAVNWPKKNQSQKEKSPLDIIEYFLCWSKIGGYKRVYAFTEKNQDGILNEQDGEPGEKWPIDLAEDDWHLTPLAFIPIPGKVNAVSTYWAGRDQYIAWQRLNRSVFFTSLKSGKSILFYPDTLQSEMQAVEESGRTITPVPYMATDLENGKLSEMIEKWEMPPVSPELLRAREEAKQAWRSIIGVDAATMIESQNMETATEAKTLQDSAQNMLANDTNAVDRFTNEVFRKEAFINLSRMPKKPIVCVKMPWVKEKPEGEFDDDTDEYEKEDGEEYLTDVPYEDAILLEKGPQSLAATTAIARSREKIGDRAVMKAATSGVEDPQQLGQIKEQAQSQIKPTPEMEVRQRYTIDIDGVPTPIPMNATCRIVNPGAEQFIGTEAAEGWVEGLTPRQIEAEIGVFVEPGSSSASGRMQNVNEVFMLYNTLAETLMGAGMYETVEELINASLKRSEIPDLDRAMIPNGALRKSMEQQQQAQMEQAKAEAEAKAAASQAPTELNPNDQIKAEAEIHKSDVGLETQKQKTEQQKLKIVGERVKGDEARVRDASASQLQMRGMKP